MRVEMKKMWSNVAMMMAVAGGFALVGYQSSLYKAAGVVMIAIVYAFLKSLWIYRKEFKQLIFRR